VGASLTLGERLRPPHALARRLRTPPLPDDLARLLTPDDPEWFARELAIAAAPPWWLWRFLLRHFSWLVGIFGRVQVTGGIPAELRDGPLLLAVNHIGDFDPFVVAVALHRVGVVPRIMATGGILAAPVVGPLLERTGAIRVERGTELARHAVRVTEVALVSGGHVVASRWRGPGRRPVTPSRGRSVSPDGGHRPRRTARCWTRRPPAGNLRP
jgi:1-acyl-sn-glycerol-3-phosphate acyltransferase